MRLWCIFATIVILAAGDGAWAEPTSAIRSTGIGEVRVAPEYLEFELDTSFAGADPATVLGKAKSSEQSLRASLAQAKLSPTELTFSGVDLAPNQGSGGYGAGITVLARFHASPFLSSDKGLETLGTFCTEFTALVKALGFQVKALRWGIYAKGPHETAALVAAVENAYPQADVVANSMNGALAAVEEVVLSGITWKTATDAAETQVRVPQLVCKATLEVTYTFVAVGP